MTQSEMFKTEDSISGKSLELVLMNTELIAKKLPKIAGRKKRESTASRS